MTGPKKILPYGRQSIDETDIRSVTEVLQSDYLTTGPVTREFESRFADKVAARHALAVNSGTSGLHLAMMALGIGKVDAVIVPSLTFLASANCIEYVGAEVVFADVNPDNGLMELPQLQKAYDTHKGNPVKAVIPVHLNGQTTDLQAIHSFAREHDLYVVEDACHALGGVFKDHESTAQPIGNCRYSDITMFSGHPVKSIAMGEAGILTTNDPELDNNMRLMASHNMVKAPGDFTNKDMAFDENGNSNIWYYEMPAPGYNFRCSDIHCALGLSQLQKLDGFCTKRQALVDQYLEEIETLAPSIKPIAHTNKGTYCWHLFPVLCDFKALGMSRNAMMLKLREQGILTQVHYIPVSEQPYYKSKYPDVSVPGAMEYYEHVLSLPLYPDMNKDDVGHVISTLKDIQERP